MDIDMHILPLSMEVLLDLAVHFLMTWAAEAMCIGAIIIFRRRQAVAGNLQGRLGGDLSDTSRIWVLPLYVWGLEACLIVSTKVHAPMGLVCPPLSYFLNWIYEVGLALFFLVVCQSLAVMLVDGPSVTLGLSGGRNLTGIAVILCILLISVTYLWVIGLYQKPYGIPLDLREVQISVARRSNFALVLQDLGDLPGARELLEQALALDLEMLGEDHPSVAPAASNLALLLKDLGKPAEAMAMIQIAIRAVAGQPEGSYNRSKVELIAEFLESDDLPLP